MDHEIVTAIIPTYKRPQKLKRAILSALGQTYPHVRVCVYDNASCDETEEVVFALAQSDPRVHYFCHSTTIDAKDNFQFGLSQVESEYFSFLGDDDLLLPTFYETTLAQLRRYPEALCCVGSAVDIEEGGKIVDIPLSRWPSQSLFVPPEGLFAVIEHYVNWCGTLFRKEARELLGPLHNSVKTFDFEYLLRLSSRFPFLIAKEPCAFFIHHGQAYSGKRLPKLYWPSWQILFENLQGEKSLKEEDKTLALKLLDGKLHSHLLAAALYHLENGNYAVAQEIAAILEERFPGHSLHNQALQTGIRCAKKGKGPQWLLTRLIRLAKWVRYKSS